MMTLEQQLAKLIEIYIGNHGTHLDNESRDTVIGEGDAAGLAEFITDMFNLSPKSRAEMGDE